MTRHLLREEIDDLFFIVQSRFVGFADFSDANELTESVIYEVVEDLEETADDDFNGSDVDIALTRVLRKRLLGDK